MICQCSFSVHCRIRKRSPNGSLISVGKQHVTVADCLHFIKLFPLTFLKNMKFKCNQQKLGEYMHSRPHPWVCDFLGNRVGECAGKKKEGGRKSNGRRSKGRKREERGNTGGEIPFRWRPQQSLRTRGRLGLQFVIDMSLSLSSVPAVGRRILAVMEEKHPSPCFLGISLNNKSGLCSEERE